MLTSDQVTKDPAETEANPPEDSPIGKALLALEQKDLAAARRHAETAISEKKNGGAAWNVLGLVALEENLPAEAEEHFTKAIQHATATQSGQYFFNRASARLKNKNPVGASEDFDSAVEFSPSNHIFSNTRYLFRIQNGESEQVRSSIALKMQLGLTQNAVSWVMAAAALALLDGANAQGAEFLSSGMDMLPQQDFDALLAHEVFEPYQQVQEVLPYFLRSSTVRNREPAR